MTVDAVVVDTHVHGPHFVPQPFRFVYRFILRRTMPPAEGFDILNRAGVHVVVGTAVGDPVVTRWYGGSPWDAVQAQLRQLINEIRLAGGDIVLDAASARALRTAGRPGLILGVEGLDAIEGRLDRLDELHDLGVRLAIPVHLRDNQIGSTALPWQQYVGPLPVRRRGSGLSRFGRAVVDRLATLGIMIDVSHADHPTTIAIVGMSTGPVVASHSGARACHDFARYLADDEVLAIAGTGGVIGLWPYFHRGRGVHDAGDLVRHARHLADLVGAEHLCIGTDMNGVPGVMDGYRGERDFSRITAELRRAGFSSEEVSGVAGENFLRVLQSASPGKVTKRDA